jgi:hypothetical protein
MHRRITEQNHDLTTALNMSPARTVWNNLDLCDELGIQPPPETYRQDYVASDVDVKIFKGNSYEKQLG